MLRAHKLGLILIGGLLAVSAPAMAQSQPDPIADKLRAQHETPLPGETYHRAPDSAQTPEELQLTRALNDEIRAQNELADNEDRANQAAHDAAMQRHSQDVSRYETERANLEARTRAEEAAYRNSQALYQQQMDAWRATVAACERGDRARCRAGQTPPPQP